MLIFFQIFKKAASYPFLGRTQVIIECDEKHSTLEEYHNLINKRLDYLTKFFSFSGVECVLCTKDTEYIDYENSVMISKNNYIFLKTTTASFPSSNGRKTNKDDYVDIYEIVSRIRFDLFFYKKQLSQSKNGDKPSNNLGN